MPSTLPCPNPACTHVFNAEAVKGAASVVCPRCGTKLEFRAAASPAARSPVRPAKPAAPKSSTPPRAAAPAKPVAPAARPAAPPPLAKPVAAPAPPVAAAPAIPLATPVTAAPAPSSSLAFGSQPDVLLTPPRRRKGLPGWLIALFLVVGVFGIMAALVVGALVSANSWGSHAPGGDAPGPGADEYKFLGQQGNFRLAPPGAPWQEKPGLLGAAVGYRRTKPASSLALVFRDYHTRLPREPELIDDALNRLRGAMRDVEYEVKPKDDQSVLGGQPAVRLEFQADDHDVPVHGECVTTAYRGVAYWFFTWAPVDDAPDLADEWAGLRGKFTLSDHREGWTEKPPKTAVVKGEKPPYRLEYVESVWEKQDEPKKYSPLADAVLLGYDPKDTDARSGANAAVVQVLTLEKATDLPAAVKAATDALLEIEKEKQAEGGGYLFPGAVLDPVADKGLNNGDGAVQVNGLDGRVMKFEAKKSADQSRYVVLEVVKMDEGILAVACESAWDRRDYWDQEFTALLGRLKAGKMK